MFRFGIFPGRRRRYVPVLRSSVKGRSSWGRRLILLSTLLLGGFFFLLLGSLLLGFIVFARYAPLLPSPNRLTSRELILSTKIQDRNSQPLYDIYKEERRTLVKLEDIPLHLRQATVAMEDQNFYQHSGFDPFGILRALRDTFLKGKLEGGSTITQQLIKNAFLTRERTLDRKIKEFILSIEVEQRYSKDEILQMYFNEVPYGGEAFGVEAASQMYFGKSVKDLTLAESALVAGLPAAPSKYSPFGSQPELSYWRQGEVLRRMVEDGFISSEQAQEARKTSLKFAPREIGIKAPHFVMYVKDVLTERYGAKLVEQGGLRVTTTLDLEKQEKLQQIVVEELDKVKNLKVGNGGVVALNPQTGEILAMVGSRDYFDKEHDGNVNVTLALRQPGSAFKPINYVTAFKKGYTASTLVMDVPTTFPGGAGQPPYQPENYDGKFHGPQQLRFALANSYNIPAVKVLALNGLPSVLETARDLGISTLDHPERYGLSLTLGGGEVKLLELTSAFGVFASGGLRHDPLAILKVTDSSGKVLEEFKSDEGVRVLSPELSFLMSDILSDNSARSAAFGPNSLLNITGHQVAVKTGTSNDKRDNWTIGYTPNIVVGTWVGNNDNSAMHPRLASGITGAAPIWNRSIKEFTKGSPRQSFARPSGIVDGQVDALSGLRAGPYSSLRHEIFIKGTVPQDEDNVHQAFRLCKADGKLSTPACEEAGQAEDRVFVVFKDIRSDWQRFTDDWVAAQSDPLYHPPSETSTLYFNPSGAEAPNVKIETPLQGAVLEQEFDVAAKVITPYSVTKVEFYLDGTLLGSPQTSIPYRKRFSLGETLLGEHTIAVLGHDSAGNVGSAQVKVNVVKSGSLLEGTAAATPTASPP